MRGEVRGQHRYMYMTLQTVRNVCINVCLHKNHVPQGSKVYNIKCMEHYLLSTGGCWDQIIMLHSEGFMHSNYI